MSTPDFLAAIFFILGRGSDMACGESPQVPGAKEVRAGLQPELGAPGNLFGETALARIVLDMASYLEWVRQFCLSLPHTTEKVRWEHNLLFCIGEKMYCVANLEPGNGPSKIAFRCTPEIFAELVEMEGIIPAPYMARNHWVSVTDMEPFRPAELKQHIRQSYDLVLGKLPKRTQSRLTTKPRGPAK